MVHTFLIHPDYATSARALDREHLGKQRVEAQQIADSITDLYVAAYHLGQTLPSNSYYWREWIRQIIRTYKQLPYSLAYNKVSGEIYTCTSQDTSYGDIRVVKLTFPIYHPALLMWVGHLDSLKEYIDAHIQEWMRRGYENNMKIHGITGAPRPSWTNDPAIHLNHKSSLLTKEIVRQKPIWFAAMPEFAGVPAFTEYIWPIHITHVAGA